MSGYIGQDGVWHDDWQTPTLSASVPVTQEMTVNSGVNIEDPNMWSQVSSYIASKLVAASDLAKRVGELEQRVEMLKEQNEALQRQWAQEAEAHKETQRQLQDVRNQLDHEQRAVHDLVMERDIVVQERNDAQVERNQAREEAATNAQNVQRLQRELEQERDHNRVLEERCNHMSQRIAALKDALGGLQNL